MSISALDEDGNPVDWWFAYKLPALPLPDPPSTMSGEERDAYKKAQELSMGSAYGTEYLYYDATSPTLPSALSPHRNILKSGALVNTIRQLREAAQYYDQKVGWFSYNDEHPKRNYQQLPCSPADNPGHTKGLLAFDLETTPLSGCCTPGPATPPFRISWWILPRICSGRHFSVLP